MSNGPKTVISQTIQSEKHRLLGESFDEACARRADALADGPEHFYQYKKILQDQRFLEGGRIQAGAGAPRAVTLYNCFVAPTFHDSMDGIMEVLDIAAKTMRLGGGIGYDFSPLRPNRDLIASIDSFSCGPVGFMNVFDALCATIASAGHRRGAQMAMLRVDHPDIEEFIAAKQNRTKLRNFNTSVAITDEFMECLVHGQDFPLRFNGRVYKTVDPRRLWEKIMRSTWEWAEPGVIFIDRINQMNNLNYCETIAATNPCGEQPLPPNGACLLGSFNLTKYILTSRLSPGLEGVSEYVFNWRQFKEDIPIVVRAMDNVVDRSLYPTPEQKEEALAKRRMGLGVSGLSNAAERLGLTYGSHGMLEFTRNVCKVLSVESYWASALLAQEKGPFPMWEREWLNSPFVKKVTEEAPLLLPMLSTYGCRNSHLTSIAPTGTISFGADNISSGIEPPFSLEYERTQRTPDGEVIHKCSDYAWREWGIRGKTATETTAEEHVNVLVTAQEWIDSAVSKTCNVNPNMAWADFKELYMRAWRGGAKGCTTFNPEGKLFGILKAEEPAAACYIDPETGEKECA